jgi:hypothetical protein
MQIYILYFGHQALFKPSGLANDNGQADWPQVTPPS